MCLILFSSTLISCDADNETGQRNIDVNIFFSSNRTGNYELWVKKDNIETQFTDNEKYDYWWPRVSPDKEVIIYYRSPPINKNNNYEEAELWSMRIDGTNPVRLISLSDNDWKAQGVADWSPDGKNLVMAAIEGSSNRWHIFITDRNGKNVVKVSTRNSLYLDPSFSPDGSKIVFAAFPLDYDGVDASRLEIFTMNVDGSNEKRLTYDNYRDHDPYWAPDGSEIAFETAIDPSYLGVGKWALRALKSDGSDIRFIINDRNINTVPRWSNNSNVLYFHRFVFGATGFRLFQINKDGTNLQKITSGSGKYDDTDIDVVE